MADGSWEEFKRWNIEQFGESQKRGWHSTVEFWKHLVMVEATVLGLTVGLLGAGGAGAPKLLVVAWIALLLGIFVGCVLIRAGIEAEQSRRRTSFLTTQDLAEARRRVEAGELRVESDEYQGLVVAAVMQSTPEWERKKTFSAKAEEAAARWADKLPYGRFLKQGHAPLYKWLERHLVRIEVAFYLLSVAALALMIATVLTAAPRPAHASAGETAQQVVPTGFESRRTALSERLSETYVHAVRAVHSVRSQKAPEERQSQHPAHAVPWFGEFKSRPGHHETIEATPRGVAFVFSSTSNVGCSEDRGRFPGRVSAARPRPCAVSPRSQVLEPKLSEPPTFRKPGSRRFPCCLSMKRRGYTGLRRSAMFSRLSRLPTASALFVLLSSLAAAAFASAPPARLADPDRFPLPVTSLVVADLDGVSGLDLIGVNGSGVSAVLNDGHGSFGSPLTFSMGSTNLASLAVGDLDGDGRNDLVAVASANVLARLAGPALTFGPPQSVALPGASTWGIKLGDFDGDGRPDVAVTCLDSQCVAVLRNDGAGHLGAPIRIDVPGALSVPLLGDFNGDGFLDILVGLAFPASKLVLIAGRGDGAFDPPVAVSPSGTTSVHLAEADLDGDGDLDVVSHNESTMAVFVNQGSGTFAAPLPLGAYPNMYSDPVVADVDRDGRPDIAVTTRGNWFGPLGFLTLLRNRGGLSFGPATIYGVGPNVTDAGVVDLDGDGWPDGVAACGSLSNGGCSFSGFPPSAGVFVLHNSGVGTLDGMFEVAQPTWLPVRSGAHALPDLLGASPAGLMFRSRNLGNGTFESAEVIGWGTPIAARDLDADGKEELLVTSGDSLWVLPNLGAEGFGPPSATFVGYTFRDFAHFHGDARFDLLVTAPDSEFVMFPGDGGVGFGAPVDLGRKVGVGPDADDVRSADLDGDGFADVAYATTEKLDDGVSGYHYVTKLFTLLNDHSGAFSGADSSVVSVDRDYAHPQSHGPGFLRIGDWNGDGIADAIRVTDACETGNGASEQVFVGAGDGTFAGVENSSSGVTSWCDVRAGDLNGDHLDDLVSVNSTSGCNFHAYVRSGDGTGAFPSGIGYPMGVQPVEAHLADLDGDGRLDVVTRNEKLFGARTYSIRRNVTPHSGPTPVLVSLVSADVSGGVVHLDWFAAGTSPLRVSVQRRSGAEGWRAIGERSSDGTGHLRFEDREVVAGESYGYRLVDAQGELAAAESWVSVPGAALALAVWPNPASGHPAVTFTLPAAGEIDLTVLDVAGRLVQRAHVAGLDPGSHRFPIGPGLAPGLYVARVMFAGHAARTRFVVTR